MKAIILAITTLIAPAIYASAWPNTGYTSVRAYSYNIGGGPASIIENDQLNPSVVNPDGEPLTKAQITRLITALTGKHSSHPLARCFNPRQAFVFYGDSGGAVAVVDICFECLTANATPEGTVFPYDFPALAELCAELGLPEAPDSGFREWFDTFRKSFYKKPKTKMSRTKR